MCKYTKIALAICSTWDLDHIWPSSKARLTSSSTFCLQRYSTPWTATTTEADNEDNIAKHLLEELKPIHLQSSSQWAKHSRQKTALQPVSNRTCCSLHGFYGVLHYKAVVKGLFCKSVLGTTHAILYFFPGDRLCLFITLFPHYRCSQTFQFLKNYHCIFLFFF